MNEALDLNTAIEGMVAFADEILVDTCSLLDGRAKFWETFWPHCKPILMRYGKRLDIPKEVYGELKAVRDNPEKPFGVRERAAWSRQAIKDFCRANTNGTGSEPINVAQLRNGHPFGSHADRVILALVDMFYRNNVVVLTQDRNLATDLIHRAQSLSVRRQPIKVMFLQDGFPRYAAILPDRQEREGRTVQATPVFGTGAPLTDLSRKETNAPPYDPQSDPFMTAEGEVVLLTNRIASGGEGVVYGTDLPFVAKIYKKTSPVREAKLRRWMEVREECGRRLSPTITYPSRLLFDAQKRLVGFLMNPAPENGRNLSYYLIGAWPNGFTRRHLVGIAKGIVQCVAELHAFGVIIGDLNAENVLIAFKEGLPFDENPADVWFVDIDSCQIEGLPCLVKQDSFTFPERRVPNPTEAWRSPLKTLEEDRFALAVLLFKLLMVANQDPYSQRGDFAGKSDEAAFQGCFPYPWEKGAWSRDDPRWKKQIPGVDFKERWERLPAGIRLLFGQTFTRGQDNLFHPASAEKWLRALERYAQDIEEGRCDASLDFEYGKRRRYCRECHTLFPSFRLSEFSPNGHLLWSDLCENCLKKPQASPQAATPTATPPNTSGFETRW